MGLELRLKNGKFVRTFYGRYVDRNGKRHCKRLDTEVKGNPPEGLRMRLKGDAAFEASREIAEKELTDFLRESADATDAAYHIQKLVENKTNTKWEEPPLDVLPGTVRGATHRRQRSKQHEVWKVKTVQNFVDWAKGRGLSKVLEVTPAVAREYIDAVYQPNEEGRTRTAANIRKIKATLGHSLKLVLPEAIPNPFQNVAVETTDGDRVFNREPLNPAEVDALLKAASEDPTAFDLIVTGLSTGLRRGDVCRLKWSSVDLRGEVLKLTTSKTRAELYLPIMPRLRTVLQGRLAERKEGATYVFPEAERELRTNPSGVSRRIKRAFALAFAKPQEATQDAPELVPLAKTLPEVLKAVQAAKMTAGKRAKMIDLLNRYASGQSYRMIQQERSISRGGISTLLHEAQRLAKVRFLADAQAPGMNAAIRDVTRTARAVGLKAASKYDFHGLRTTFVTLALNAGVGVDKLKALTGHHTVETVMRHYFKPRGTDARNELRAALPASLTETAAELPEAKTDPVATLAAQLQALTGEQRAQLAAMLKQPSPRYGNA